MNDREWQQYADVYINFGKEEPLEIVEKETASETLTISSEQLSQFAKKIHLTEFWGG